MEEPFALDDGVYVTSLRRSVRLAVDLVRGCYIELEVGVGNDDIYAQEITHNHHPKRILTPIDAIHSILS